MIDFVRVADGADIVFKNVTKKYGNLAVYENFDFTIKRGAITCILGESGSGKTTLLNMIAGLTPYEGSITPALKCSYVFQEPRLVPNLTVRGNLSLVCKDKRRTDEMLAAVERKVTPYRFRAVRRREWLWRALFCTLPTLSF